MSNHKSKTTIFFFPGGNGDGFLLILFIPFIILGLIGLGIVALFNNFGMYVESIPYAYLSILGFIFALLVKPKQLATSFGTQQMTETEIQDYFEQIDTVFGGSLDYINASIIFALIAFLIFLMYYYKKGIIKGKARWIGRYILINILITTHIWYYFMNTYEEFFFGHTHYEGYYTIIYKSMQKDILISFAWYIVFCFVISTITHIAIVLVGKNKLERDKRRSENKQRKLEQKKLKRQKAIEKRNNKEYY
ncbi:hypothetical protein EDC19_0468 [Natranaerovirga hydrolytica]|uniref:Uncharacterized protein n=1 Tax=Natranaerovirga hydrolytica TaxID=680378 RepID=A0A4R1N5Z9_9FIRM|nr:hypothetical protein [Natranaerovirga hydrolytica]TCK98053.1 hypothetical protein EDC19_0468 [Natranaerovirga hydrolytica]